MNRVGVAIALSLCIAGSCIASGGDRPSRDWKQHPTVVEVETDADIYAVGDPHADYDRFANVLVAAKIIGSVPASPEQVSWTAGKSVLVITGDMIDKGSDSLEVIALVRALGAAAAAQGGRVIATMGNHEAEFLAKPTKSKTKDFQDALTKKGMDPSSVAACKGDIGEFLCALPIAARVNDWFFSHAGNTATCSDTHCGDGCSIAKIASDIEKGFAKKGFGTDELIGDHSILEARLSHKGPRGLPWFYAGSEKSDPRDVLTRYAKALGVCHIVQGHQPGAVKFPHHVERNPEELFQRYGLLFLIDGGMSHGIEDSKSVGGALHITAAEGGKATAICPKGPPTELWNGRTNPDTGRVLCDK